MFNNNTTATRPQNVPVKKFWKSVNIWRRYGQSQSGTFFEIQCTCIPAHAPFADGQSSKYSLLGLNIKISAELQCNRLLLHARQATLQSRTVGPIGACIHNNKEAIELLSFIVHLWLTRQTNSTKQHSQKLSLA